MKVSVIIPAYNCATFLGQSVGSVLKQTYSDWEILIAIDPGSTDQTAWVARTLAGNDGRIRLFYPSERGVAAARNLCLENAKGRFAAFLDADDIWLPGKLTEQLRFMMAGRYPFTSTFYRRFDGLTGAIGRRLGGPLKISRLRLLQQNSILCSTVMIDLAFFTEPVRFIEVGCEDYDLWLRLLRKSGFCHVLNQDLARYRVSQNSRGSSKWRSLKESWSVFRRDGLNPAEALFIMVPFVVRGAAKYSRF